ncbi:MAG TPA: chalcone isomerase family protein [Parachlamydiaceae bacterium]|nr:chalcone isomerase family protein [Parachlamydiaceae bacterium]
MIFKLLSSLILFCAFNLHADSQITDKETGTSFPTEISFNNQGKDYQLEATGVATRKKLFFKVYSVAHYLQKGVASGADKLQAIMSDANAKQLTIKWVRDIEAAKIQEGYVESFKNAVSDQGNSQLQSDIKTYISWYGQDVVKGDEHIIRWIPGGIIEVQMKGKTVGTITNPEFAKGLWSIWFGSKSVVKRDNLISLMN